GRQCVAEVGWESGARRSGGGLVLAARRAGARRTRHSAHHRTPRPRRSPWSPPTSSDPWIVGRRSRRGGGLEFPSDDTGDARGSSAVLGTRVSGHLVEEWFRRRLSP